MAHRREVILEKVQALIEAASTDAGSNIFRARLDDIPDTQLPSVQIFQGPDEIIGQDELGGPTNFSFQDRYLAVLVKYQVTGATLEAVETALNKLDRQVHVALRASYNLGIDFVIQGIPNGTDQPELSKDNDVYGGSMISTWYVQYRAPIDDPEEP